MSRYVYISCGENERELEPVKALRQFLMQSGCAVVFIPNHRSDCLYRGIEDEIERSDVFIAVCGFTRTCSCGLAHELEYAAILCRMRMRHRPRVFALRIENYELPNCSKHHKVEWLEPANFHLLLEDLPFL